MLHPGDTVALVGCSDGRVQRERPQLEAVAAELESAGLQVRWSPCLYAAGGTPFSAPPRRRAAVLTDFFADETVSAIFDVSGGDGANSLLEYLDFVALSRTPKPFFGYSDLTALMNPLWEKAGVPCFLYQIRNVVRDESGAQLAAFRDTVLRDGTSLTGIPWRFLRGSAMEGIVLGGNIRCLLKLAGTPYFPDLRGKLLFLESRSGGLARTEAYFAQLRQMGVFRDIAGLLLGTFTELDRSAAAQEVESLILAETGRPDLPVARTDRVGHGPDALCLPLGQLLSLTA